LIGTGVCSINYFEYRSITSIQKIKKSCSKAKVTDECVSRFFLSLENHEPGKQSSQVTQAISISPSPLVYRLWIDCKPEITALGECGLWPGLSKELTPEFENQLTELLAMWEKAKLKLPVLPENSVSWFMNFLTQKKIGLTHSSVTFAFEQLFLIF